MSWCTRHIRIACALALLGAALLSGCGPAGDEPRSRHFRRALAAKDAQDIDGAIALCEEALARHPRLARAHRELGVMLDNYRQDYAAALYHYRRYLELRPDTPERADIEELIRHCRASFAAEMQESSGELKRVLQARDERIRRLELDVAALRTGPAPAAPPAAAPAAAAPSAPPAAAAVAQVHVVQTGESLGAISTRYYGTPAKWKTIFNANRDRVPDANNVRVGTRLDIPPP